MAKKILIVIGVIVAISLVASLVETLVMQSQTQVTSTARDNTFKNAFISGCKSEAVKTITEAEAISYCNCCYDKLLALYPDLSTNEERMDRVIAEGFTSTETDAVVVCLPESMRQ